MSTVTTSLDFQKPLICSKSGKSFCQREFEPTSTNMDCACVPCANVKLCDSWGPEGVLEANNKCCLNCAQVYGKPLTFVPCIQTCGVCLATDVEGYTHPAECSLPHNFCVDCMKTLFGWLPKNDEDAEEWKNCYDEDAYLASWMNEYNAEERWMWIEDNTICGIVRGFKAVYLSCPLCRSKYKPDWQNEEGFWAKLYPMPPEPDCRLDVDPVT